MADGNFARRPTRFPKANSHGKKGLEASEEPMPRCRTEEGGRHMAGITDVSMFLPYMARRGRHDGRLRLEFSKNGDGVNPINSELRKYRVPRDI